MSLDRRELELRGSLFEAEIGALLLQEVKDVLIIHNVELYCPQLHKETQIDVIAVTKGGIFVIEAKNFHGWIRGNYDDDKWTALSRTRKVMTIFNTLHQNFLHIRSLEAALYKKGIKFNFPIHNVICLPDDTAIYSDVKEIVNFSQLPYYIESHSDQNLKLNVNAITSLIRKL